MQIQDYIPQIIATLILLILLPSLKFVTRKLITKYGKINYKVQSRIQHIVRIFNIIINVTFFICLAMVWGVNPQNVLIALSSIFAVIGVAMFAQWSVLSNVTAGIIIYFATPFKIGDHIKIFDNEMPIKATIQTIQTFYTYLRTDEGELIVIPNTVFLQKIVAVSEDKMPN